VLLIRIHKDLHQFPGSGSVIRSPGVVIWGKNMKRGKMFKSKEERGKKGEERRKKMRKGEVKG
jgi:hypothetical protein